MGGGRADDRIDVMTARVEIPEHVVSRAFVDQSVALNLKTGTYHALNATAARMLEVLADVEIVADAVPMLAQALGQPVDVIERSLATLCRDLAERGLIEFRDAGGG
jgi:hypothetical protein